MRVHGLLDQSAEAASRSHRFMSLVASFSDKRRQMIERVVDRTLSAYTIHGEAIADSGWSESASIANLSKD